MKKSIFVAVVVSLGGFLFGFDAGIISGVMSYASPEFNLTDLQNGWAVSAPSAAAIFAMIISGRLSDIVGRKKLLIYVALLYAVSAVLSAYAPNYHMLWIARFIGGVAFGAALVIAPAYIAEISSAENRGRLVSVQQLNIVLGFFAAFLSNYFFNKALISGQSDFLTESNVWRWMLGVELLPALAYFLLMFLVPKSPRWLYSNNDSDKAKLILVRLHGKEQAQIEINAIEKGLKKQEKEVKKIQLKPVVHFK